MEKNRQNFIGLFLIAVVGLVFVLWLAIFGLRPKRIEVSSVPTGAEASRTNTNQNQGGKE